MSGNTQKEEIYRTAMRICRMWGVAETLDSGIPPYETPISTQTVENEKLVLQWAEEYVRLRENGEELWRFFEKKIKILSKPEQKKYYYHFYRGIIISLSVIYHYNLQSKEQKNSYMNIFL